MTNERTHVRVLADPIEVAHAAAESFVSAAQAVLADRPRFSVALSGGSTPRATYETLATQFATRVRWPSVEVFFGDERCVPPGHHDSNYGMARTALLDHVPLGADRVHRMLGERQPEEAARAYEETLVRVLGPEPRLDLVLLGVGPDGHTASLFPGTPVLEERTRKVAAVFVQKFDSWRVTLTVPTLNAAAHVIILAVGDEKAEPLARAFHGAPGEVPIQLIRPTSGQLTWILDRKAASKLRL
jgi:6-phosphogluconolactonase